ncbi:hypothetical protein [Lichenicoccus sp.]|uniref:hypothetical protein n=1 Tax=Lichenicoccus sp. TaxID=2781899 RepID=UPI003D15009B
MLQREIAEGNILSTRRGKAGLGMQHDSLSNIAAEPDGDPFNPTTQHDAPPGGGIGLKPDKADHDRKWRDPTIVILSLQADAVK